MAQTHGIKITPFFQKRYLVNVIDCYRVRIVASDSVNMPTKIFRYLGRPALTVVGNAPQLVTNADMAYDFNGVCSPSDLEDFPEDLPGPTDDPAWCRLDTVDLLFRSKVVALKRYDEIIREIGALVDSLDAADDLEERTPLQFGPEYNPPES